MCRYVSLHLGKHRNFPDFVAERHNIPAEVRQAVSSVRVSHSQQEGAVSASVSFRKGTLNILLAGAQLRNYSYGQLGEDT